MGKLSGTLRSLRHIGVRGVAHLETVLESLEDDVEDLSTRAARDEAEWSEGRQDAGQGQGQGNQHVGMAGDVLAGIEQLSMKDSSNS